jgi:hypothetical protein
MATHFESMESRRLMSSTDNLGNAAAEVVDLVQPGNYGAEISLAVQSLRSSAFSSHPQTRAAGEMTYRFLDVYTSKDHRKEPIENAQVVAYWTERTRNGLVKHPLSVERVKPNEFRISGEVRPHWEIEVKASGFKDLKKSFAGGKHDGRHESAPMTHQR